jgi:hypothetical protein
MRFHDEVLSELKQLNNDVKQIKLNTDVMKKEMTKKPSKPRQLVNSLATAIGIGSVVSIIAQFIQWFK